MMVCITAQAAGLQAPIEHSLAHAPFFTFIEMETGEVHSVANALCGRPRGAGVRAARFIVEYGARAVVTGRIDPEAARVFQEASIAGSALTSEETVTEAFEAFRAGRLQEAAGTGRHAPPALPPPGIHPARIRRWSTDWRPAATERDRRA